ncbi:hypothetical protein [Actinomadura sp. 9N407]|uniref:hypothetical protein n=1 Tax=Actinomadura sp. 9N407 TaxID=3375154 RepID=UPI0037BA7D9E
MNAHLSDSDRQALRLAHDLREEMRQALPRQAAGPSVSPFVDPSGRPAVLLKMDEETARAMMALLVERREQAQRYPEARRADGTHVPPPPEPAMAAPPPRHVPYAPHATHAPHVPHVTATDMPVAPMTAGGPPGLLPTVFPLH